MFDLDFLCKHADLSFEKADYDNSKLNQDVLNLKGMTGFKTKHLYNNLCSIDGINHLEIGIHKGATFISSMFGNNSNSIGIDNWSEYSLDVSTELLLSNINTFCPNTNFKFIEKDSFKINDNDIFDFYPSVDVYVYDGCHEYESHKKAITNFSKYLSKYSIIVVDDWRGDNEWEKVRLGTYDGFTESGLKIHKTIEVVSKEDGTGYWNGFGLFVVEKI
jgi:hypothetical protein